jgi:UDP-N-acetylmuramoylalanine-D-glutamate ligase
VTLDPVSLDAVLARRVAVWGMGAEGLAFAALAVGRGVEPVLIDDHPAEAAERVAATPVGERAVLLPADVDWGSVDVVVRAPGVSRYRPELAAAEAVGVTVTTAMALWLVDHADAPVLAITGTKGKSTTAALAAAILEADGRKVELIGNIGVPVLDTYGHPRPDVYVVEISSYQAADVTRSPGVVVLTSLAPDHLDWHGGVEAYYRDKLRLVEAGPVGHLARTAGHPDRMLFGPAGRVRVDDDGWVVVDGTRLVDAGRLQVPGRHNAWNLCGAIAGIVLLTGEVPSTEAVGSAVDGFAGLPSRCHVLGERNGITYVDDALASNPFASAASIVAALAAHRPTAVVVVLPPDPDRLVTALAGVAARVTPVADLAEAVLVAEGLTPAGGVVLFSPGAPTAEGGGGYRARSQAFSGAAGLPER